MTNHIVFPQRIRFSELLRKACLNPLDFTNSIFKKGKQNPKKLVLQCFRLAAREVLFRLTMMFLHTNQETIRKKMKLKELPEGLCKEYRMKMDDLLSGMYPPSDRDPLQQHVQMEKWVGHEFITEAIFLNSRSRTARTRIFSIGIPELQWKAFVEKEEDEKKKPKITAEYKCYRSLYKKKVAAESLPKSPSALPKSIAVPNAPKLTVNDDPEGSSCKLVGNW